MMDQLEDRADYLADILRAEGYSVKEDANSVILHFGDAGDTEVDETRIRSLTTQEFGDIPDGQVDSQSASENES